MKVLDISRDDFVERNLMLIKIDAPPSQRLELQGLVQIFRGRIVNVGLDQMMVEISSQEKKIEAFIDAVRPYGILGTGPGPAGSPWSGGHRGRIRRHVSNEEETADAPAVIGHSSL